MDYLEPILYETMYQTPLISLAILVCNIQTLYRVCFNSPKKDMRHCILAVLDFLSIIVYLHAAQQYFYYGKRIFVEIHCALAIHWFSSILLVTIALDHLTGNAGTIIRFAVITILSLLIVLLDNKTITKALKLSLTSSQFYSDILITFALSLPYLDLFVLTGLMTLRLFCMKTRAIEKDALGNLNVEVKLEKQSMKCLEANYMLDKGSLENSIPKAWNLHKSIDVGKNLGMVLRLLGVFLFFVLPYHLCYSVAYWVPSFTTNDGLFLVPMFISCLRTIFNSRFYGQITKEQVYDL
uniref:Uncharacterized protein n=1 Tax=Clytia hemisphaerica TaxID=252671 RepID=A0A7M5WUC1_9CNID